MFSNRPNYLKLRTNLRLCINRLKLLEKKKTELALKARREISDYIAAGKDDRARIRVEHIIREDYLVEAMEIIEMLCDLLLARFGLIEKMAELDPGLEEAVATLIWVAPRLCGDVQEIREVAHQLTIKYGKEFAEMCRRNGFESVNEKVVHKMSLAAPPKILVEHYMIEIARTYKVPFEPDPLVMMGQPPEASNLIDLGVDALSPMSGSTGRTAAELKAAEAWKTGGGGGGGGGGSQCHFPFPSVPGSVGPGAGMPAGNNSNNTTSPNGFGNYSGGSGKGFGAGSGSSGGGGGFSYGTHGGAEGGGAYGGVGASAGCPIYSNAGFPHDPVYGNIGTVGDGTFGFPENNSAVGLSGSNNGTIGADKGVSAGGPGGTVSGGGGSGVFQNVTGGSDADYSSALVGGVPVLPSEGQFPPPLPEGFRQPSGAVPSSSHAGINSQSGGPGNERAPLNPQMSWINEDYLPSLPPYDQVVSSPNQYPMVHPQVPGAGAATSGNGKSTGLFPDIPALPDVPGLPSVPSNSIGGASVGGDDVDFDDLTRRFEELKRRK